MTVNDMLEAVEGWLSADEGERLEALAADVPSTRHIVEVGAYRGRATCWMATGSRRGHGARITSVDPWAWDAADLPTWEANVAAGGWADLVTACQLTSAEAAVAWDGEIGLLFLDAVHEFEPTRADYDAWQGYIPPGGWIAFHDCSPAFPGVQRVILEVVDTEHWHRAEQVGSLWTAQRR